MDGFGIDTFGLSPFGIGGPAAADMVITGAWATSTRSIRVQLSRPPRATSPLDPGSARNPRVWTVSDSVSGREMFVLAVAAGPLNLQWDLYLLQELSPFGDSHVVTSEALRDTLGALIGEPNSWTFSGAVAAAQRSAAQPARDLKSDPLVGGLTVSSSGDYEEHDGRDLLRKLLVRRVITMPGEFVHMPDYGLGLKVKEPLTTSDLVALQAEAQRQAEREPDVVSAKASISLSSSGILQIALSVKMATGEETSSSTTVHVSVQKF